MPGSPLLRLDHGYTEAALRRLYRWEALAQQPSIRSMVLDYSPRDKDALTPIEKAADGAVARSRLQKNLTEPEFLAIDALHTVPIGQLRRRKVRACTALAKLLFNDLRLPGAFIADQIRWWVGGPSFCIRDEQQWGEQLNCSVRTVLYKRNGRPDRKMIGIAGMLDAAYDKALWAVENGELV